MLDIITGDVKALEQAIEADKHSYDKENAEAAQRYYDYEHDILSNKIYFMNDNEQLVEDKYASNIKIPHPFFTEIVSQSVSTELANGVKLKVEDEEFQVLLEEYWDEDIQLFLQEMLEGASIKGKEYAYVRQLPGEMQTSRISFQVSDSLQTFTITDESGDVVGVVRYYTKPMLRDDKQVEVEHAEVWTSENVTFYLKNKDNAFIINPDKSPNPRSHILAEQKGEDGKPVLLGKSFGRIPFRKLKNNKKEKTDLEPIKELIDDYDLMNAFMSNNLQDYSGAIYVTKGYNDDVSKLRMNVRSKGGINVDEDGAFDMKTYDIPVDGRVKKMELDKRNIYKFGMAFDSTAISDSSGSVTNVQIMAGYSLLMMKLSKKEAHLKTLIDWMIELITEDINRRYSAAYDHRDIEVIIERETMVNRLENVQIEKTEAETKQLKLTALLDIAMFLPQEKVLREICDIVELDWNEIEAMLLEDVSLPSLQGVGDENGDDEQVGEGDRSDIPEGT
ncbi:phage portal protein [Alkalibacterium sp. f15]|uniref:phage portal protein n=1 Tax=Alkalibacterium sp. f15 TaxID=3414029 RepID=UPI003BF783BE